MAPGYWVNEPAARRARTNSAATPRASNARSETTETKIRNLLFRARRCWRCYIGKPVSFSMFGETLHVKSDVGGQGPLLAPRAGDAETALAFPGSRASAQVPCWMKGTLSN